ncbi:MAG: ATP-binding cassette domain-containing protein [Collinsella sp.]
MPQGYDTRVANDAESISQGQRQLLTIARVLLNNPAILILTRRPQAWIRVPSLPLVVPWTRSCAGARAL